MEEVAEVLAKQVPLKYFIGYMESKDDIVMKLEPFDQEDYNLYGAAGIRHGSITSNSNIFAILRATSPQLFTESTEYSAITNEWLDGTIYDVPAVCRASKKALKTQKHMREVIKNKAYQSDDFFLFVALKLNIQIYVFNILDNKAICYNSEGTAQCVALLNIGGHYELWMPTEPNPHFTIVPTNINKL